MRLRLNKARIQEGKEEEAKEVELQVLKDADMLFKKGYSRNRARVLAARMNAIALNRILNDLRLPIYSYR